jgi:Type IV secretory system Conjugative DNA transfer
VETRIQTDPWDLQSGIYEGDRFHPRHSFSGWAKLRMKPKFPFRQFFDFRFGVSASASRVLLMLDEFPSLGKLDILQQSLAADCRLCFVSFDELQEMHSA